MKAFLYAKILLPTAVAVAAMLFLVSAAVTPCAAADTQCTRINIVLDGKAHVYEDAPIAPSDFTVAEEIAMRRINSSLEKKIELVDTYLKKGADYKTALGVCFPLLVRFIDGLGEEVYVPCVDSTVRYDKGKFYATEEKCGTALDEDKLYAAVYYDLKFSDGERSVNAHKTRIYPTVTKSMLQSQLVLRGEYTTEYTTSSAARAHNVSLALSKFDGMRIAKGEKLSFNATVGERTAENGFKNAKIIVDGNYTDGIGGGACQASTALYNAALVSGMKCAANAHSICPSYCPPGLDAMISSVSDLVIENTTDHDVYISVSIKGARAAVRMYGERPEYKIVPQSEVIETTPCETEENIDSEHKFFDISAASGDRLLVVPGKDGVKSATFLKYYKDGEFVKRVKIRVNSYKSVPQVIAVAP